MTNLQWIRALPELKLAEFLRSIERSPDGPWQAAFENCICAECQVAHCDLCPHGDEIEWWLRQEVG